MLRHHAGELTRSSSSDGRGNLEYSRIPISRRGFSAEHFTPPAGAVVLGDEIPSIRMDQIHEQLNALSGWFSDAPGAPAEHSVRTLTRHGNSDARVKP